MILFYLLFNRKKFWLNLFNSVPKEFVNEFYGQLLNRIPKEFFITALNKRIEEEKKQKLSLMMQNIENQSKIKELLEDYEKKLDITKKEIGDKVKIWDFTSASYEDSEESLSLVLNDDEKDNFGECIVSDNESEYKLSVNIHGHIYEFIQDIVLYTKNSDKKIRINSKHVNLV